MLTTVQALRTEGHSVNELIYIYIAFETVGRNMYKNEKSMHAELYVCKNVLCLNVSFGVQDDSATYGRSSLSYSGTVVCGRTLFFWNSCLLTQFTQLFLNRCLLTQFI